MVYLANILNINEYDSLVLILPNVIFFNDIEWTLDLNKRCVDFEYQTGKSPNHAASDRKYNNKYCEKKAEEPATRV